MNDAFVHRHRPPVGGGPLLALVALAALMWASLSGNSLSMHVGTSFDALASSVGQVDRVAGPVAATPPTADETAGLLVTVASDPTVPVSADAQHLMHVVGGCVAILAAAVLLLLLVVLSSGQGSGPSVVAAARRLLALPASVWWTPPALNPPTSSPVIRT